MLGVSMNGDNEDGVNCNEAGVLSELPLSVVFDQLEVDGEQRGRDFVRRVCGWLHDRAARIEFRFIEELALEEVVVTFAMRDEVSLVVTGYSPNGLPGAVTVKVDEEEFPRVMVRVLESKRRNPYELCTMDYSFHGTTVHIHRGGVPVPGIMLVATTIGTEQNCRIRLDSGEIITAKPSELLGAEAVNIG
tara:strand:- start:100 stop:669 length:570 start_codon:yes stop_codon:yes gene_type:complete